MQRLLAIPCLIGLLLVWTAQAEDPKPKPKSAAKETPDAIFAELVKKFRATKAEEEQQKVIKDYSEKLLDYAKKNPASEEGFKALGFLMRVPGGAEKAAPGLKEFTKVKLGKGLKRLPATPDNATILTFLVEVIKENPDKASKAYAAKALIGAYEQAKQFGDRIKEDEGFKEKVEKARGKNFVKQIQTLADKADGQIKKLNDQLAGELKGVFPNLTIGSVAPEVVSQNLEGKEVKLSDLKGKVVVLDIWATWCPPCRAMIPHSKKLVEKMKDKPFVMVSISADDEKETLVKFIKDTPMPWTHWYAGRGGIVEDWEVEAFPTIYILDAKGVIREKMEGADNKKIEDTVEKLVKELEDKKTKSE